MKHIALTFFLTISSTGFSSSFSFKDRFIACAGMKKFSKNIYLFYIDRQKKIIKFESESGGSEIHTFKELSKNENSLTVYFKYGEIDEVVSIIKNTKETAPIGLWQEIGSENHQNYPYCTSNDSIKKIQNWVLDEIKPLKKVKE